jgi:hypothetical protein
MPLASTISAYVYKYIGQYIQTYFDYYQIYTYYSLQIKKRAVTNPLSYGGWVIMG